MIYVDNVHVYNIANAIYSARNPMNSWGKSDSDVESGVIGENDLALAQKLYQAGTEHRKYLRQIFVSMDILAPFYWWKEFDTYKIGTTSNSCSTMHKLTSKEITMNDFSFDYFYAEDIDINVVFSSVVSYCEVLRKKFIETKNKMFWKALIELLPEAYNQKRSITMNYENVVSMIHQRENHKLSEWNEFIEILKALPYVMDITKGQF